MSKNKQYPEEAASIIRQQTFSVTPRFVLAKSEDGEDPAKVHNSNFSRVDLTIIDKDKKFVNSTIKFVSIPGIMAASQYAYTKHMDAIYAPQKTTGGQSAFQMKFFSGALKGQTIAQVALEQGEDVLKKQYDWLKQNLEKFPKNKQLMDAINETVKALREGKLSAGDATPASASCITIYDSMKGNPHKPLKEGSNLFFVHDLKVKYYLGDNYPVHVTIKNYYAPLNKEENGQQKIDFNGRDVSTEIEATFKLTADEWTYVLYQIKASEDRFERVNQDTIEKDIKKAVEQNRKAAQTAETKTAQGSNPKAGEGIAENAAPAKQKQVDDQKPETVDTSTDAPNKAEQEKPFEVKIKTVTPLTKAKKGKDLFVQGITQGGEEKTVRFRAEAFGKVDPVTWSSFMNKTQLEGCTFRGMFVEGPKAILDFVCFP